MILLKISQKNAQEATYPRIIRAHSSNFNDSYDKWHIVKKLAITHLPSKS